MICIWLLIWACINSSSAQQYYDYSDCSEDSSFPGSRYTCTSVQNSCNTFLVYRANGYFRTFSNITQLFQLNSDESDEVLQLNKLISHSEILKPGREILIPVNCSCSGRFFQANVSYIAPGSTTYSEIACTVFEGLTKPPTLAEENLFQGNVFKTGSKLHVPLKCACPDNFSQNEGVKYLVTYPFVEGDRPDLLSMKFGISLAELCAANRLAPTPTIYPNTTFLVPLKKDPVINLDIADSQPPIPGFLPTINIEMTSKSKLKTVYIVGSVLGLCLALLALLACGLYIKALRKWKGERLQSFNVRSSASISCSTARSSPRSAQTGRSSSNSCLSPDLLVGIKYSLCSYSIQDLKKATKGFNEVTKIGDQAYKGMIDNAEVMIKQMRFEDTRQVIDVHSKINHINIVSLLGVCYGESDLSWSYLCFEFPSNGCLRDCLSNPSISLRWHKRTQIAFDVATALHYLHHFIFPTYAHLSVNSRNIFLTANWRAKIANIGPIPSVGSSKGIENATIVKGWIAPEYLQHGSISEKVDIFAFGVVLLELLSAREDMDGRLFKDSIGFLGGSAIEGGCFEQLRSFMDPSLKEDYPLAEALCFAVLAKACVEDDPLHRPSMNDIMKVLARTI
ncbi:LysM receptor kinase [Melia azedarach]|uniref:LysM receptor kinase n=2 Tax=Melia azedarach TaxID=155640 RepID=A0ACC1YPX9_MELAZ|nr:LysM receptor kinase [Melia azedarach]KAJ4725084.1 LysM receptor kinase [Melia azedarach]